MRQTKILMGMPVTVEVVDKGVCKKDIDDIFKYFQYIDNKFSTFKEGSEITQINEGKLSWESYSLDMKKIFRLSEKTKKETGGYFDIKHNRKYDPSGLVKGWAIRNAANLLREKGFKNFYVDAGGDIEVQGKNKEGKKWEIGIRNPFNVNKIVKKVILKKGGIATSGTYERGQHIYNPKEKDSLKYSESEIVSLTVIGPNIYEADRFATAAFAMGKKGIYFIQKLKGFEGYMIDRFGKATSTSGFEKYA